MPATRSTSTMNSDDFNVLLCKKFEELKVDLVNELKALLVVEIKKEIGKFIEEKNQEIVSLKSSVSLLQQQVNEICKQNLLLQEKSEDSEQYSRRQCLRFEGIPVAKDETSEEVYHKIEHLLSENDITIPENVLDRAHRIGPVIKDESGHETQTVIVRFSTFKHSTKVYKARKYIKDNVRIRLDLTKNRYKLLRHSSDLVKNNENIKFVYADINCRLKIRMVDGGDKVFSDIDDIKDILESFD